MGKRLHNFTHEKMLVGLSLSSDSDYGDRFCMSYIDLMKRERNLHFGLVVFPRFIKGLLQVLKGWKKKSLEEHKEAVSVRYFKMSSA